MRGVILTGFVFQGRKLSFFTDADQFSQEKIESEQRAKVNQEVDEVNYGKFPFWRWFCQSHCQTQRQRIKGTPETIDGCSPIASEVCVSHIQIRDAHRVQNTSRGP